MDDKKDVCEWEYRHPYWQSGCAQDMDLTEDFNGPKSLCWEYCPWCGGKIEEYDGGSE